MPLQTPKRKPPVQPRTDAPHDSATPASRSTFLYRPAEAAKHLAVKESWLRRKASLRAIPCTFLGKHLRFSDDDLREIIRQAQAPVTHPARPVRSRTMSRPVGDLDTTSSMDTFP
ncbi:helix-turn-helix domain-containing protein [Saccharopolyspora shandongensis]|uniref:helix-turn-helix domain-containing protein n=1 Tax=Saccharopolyspora shandongensis TaxID=418495 RepID=UPI0033C5A05E